MNPYIVKLNLLRVDPLDVISKLATECGSCSAAKAPFLETPLEPFAMGLYVETGKTVPDNVRYDLRRLCVEIDDCRPVDFAPVEDVCILPG